MDKSNSEQYNVFMKFFREVHPSIKKETIFWRPKVMEYYE